MRNSNLRKIIDKDKATAILFVNMEDGLADLAEAVCATDSARKNTLTIVCVNSRMPSEFVGLPVNVRLSEDYLEAKDYDYIDKFSVSLARGWHNFKCKDGLAVTEADSIHLSTISEFDFEEFLIWRIKYIEVARKAIDELSPKRVIVVDDAGDLSDAVRLICGLTGIEAHYINPKPLLKRLLSGISAKIRNSLSELFYLHLMDSLARFFFMASKKCDLILIDPRAHSMLTGTHGLKDHAFFMVEKGLANRLYASRRKGSYISFDIPLRGNLRKKVKSKANILLSRWRELSDNKLFRDSLTYKGIPLMPLVNSKLEEFFEESFLRTLRIMENIKYLHNKKTIRYIALRADGRQTEKAIITAAEKEDIPTLYITHGVLAENNCHDVLYCRKTAVWGKADFERYVSLGNGENRLVITGSPKYDRIFSKASTGSKFKTCESLCLDPAKKIVVFATQPVTRFSSYRTRDENRVLLESVLKAMKEFPGTQLVVKLHPFDSGIMYNKVLNEYGGKRTIIVKDVDIFELISICDALITFSSTVGLEAMILDKPVITVNLGKRKDVLPFAERGAALGVYREEDISKALRAALEDEAVQGQLSEGSKKIVAYYVHKLDGRSSERVVNIMQEEQPDASRS